MKTRQLITLSVSFLLSMATLAQAGPRTHEVGARERDQKHRIADGIKDKELTPEEVARLEKGEIAIKMQERRMALKNGGHLTKAETARLNHELDMLSKAIAKGKHN